MSLRIGQFIKSVLSANADLTALCGNRIFPVVCTDPGLNYPFIRYAVHTDAPDYTKMGVATDTHQVTLDAVSLSYDEALTVAEAVRSALELTDGETSDYSVRDIRMQSCDEAWDDDLQAYVVTLVMATESEDN